MINDSILEDKHMNVGKIFKQQQEIQRVPTYATGFVAPKTTALFFDKIWVTDQFAHEYSIPDDVRLLDKHRLLYEELYNTSGGRNRPLSARLK